METGRAPDGELNADNEAGDGPPHSAEVGPPTSMRLPQTLTPEAPDRLR